VTPPRIWTLMDSGATPQESEITLFSKYSTPFKEKSCDYYYYLKHK
jgi:hypothetical protein